MYPWAQNSPFIAALSLVPAKRVASIWKQEGPCSALYSALALWAAGTMKSSAAAVSCRYCLWSCLPHLSLGPIALPGWFSLTLALTGVRSLYLLHPDLWPEPGPSTPAAGPPPLAKVASFSLSTTGILDPMHGYLTAEDWIRKLNTGVSLPHHPAPEQFTEMWLRSRLVWDNLKHLFFLDISPQNKRRVGAVFLYQSGTRKELDGWHAQKRCLV